LRLFDLQINSAVTAWARIEKRIRTRLNTQRNNVWGLAIVQIAFLFLFRWTRFWCSWHGRWKCFQPTSSELWSASLSLFGHRKLHDNILNRCVNTYLHTKRYDGSELRHLGRMFLHNGFDIRNAPSRHDNKDIR
jgi:hypothetical protein